MFYQFMHSLGVNQIHDLDFASVTFRATLVPYITAIHPIEQDSDFENRAHAFGHL